ncbi:MAG TPA: hypothetical protein VFY89_09350, partial [Ktedonobacterales bacterium]
LADDGDATLYDASLGGGFGAPSGEAPIWPGSQPDQQPPRRRGMGPFVGCLTAVALVLACTVMLANLPGWLAAANTLTAGGLIGQRATPTATPAPTATPTPTPTPTPPANWLAVSPGTIKLGCGGKRSITLKLVNSGPDTLSWSATVDSNSFAGAGIEVQPKDGELDAGRTVKITITNQSHFFGRQGTIEFVPDNPQAGQPAGTYYQTQSC